VKWQHLKCVCVRRDTPERYVIITRDVEYEMCNKRVNEKLGDFGVATQDLRTSNVTRV